MHSLVFTQLYYVKNIKIPYTFQSLLDHHHDGVCKSNDLVQNIK